MRPRERRAERWWRRTVPKWLRSTLYLSHAEVPWHDVVRSGLALPVPMGLGLALGNPGAGVFGALGALLGVLAERSGTSGQRLARIAGAGVAGVVSQTLGRYTAGYGIEPLLLVLAFAAVSGFLSSLHPLASFAGMQLLVQMSLASGLKFHDSFDLLIACYIVGLLWVIVGVWLQGRVEHTDRLYRTALAAVPTQLAAAVRDRSDSRQPVTEAEAALMDASDLLSAARPHSRLRRDELTRVRWILDPLHACVLSVDALVSSGVDSEAVAPLAKTLERSATAITRDDPTPIRNLARVSHPDAGPFYADVLSRIREIACAISGDRRVLPKSCPDVLSMRHLRTVASSPTTWEYVVRVTLCMGLAECVRQVDPLKHSYWILLTTALVLKPDLQHVLARTLQRAVGTLAGAAVGAMLLLISSQYALMVSLGLLAACIPYAVRRNYWMFSSLITPIVFILLDFAGPTSDSIVPQRIANTLLGCAIVASFGYLLWPPTWRPPIRRDISTCVKLLSQYTCAALAPASDPSSETTVMSFRRSVCRQLSALRIPLQRSEFEPPAVRRRVAAWAKLIGELEEVSDAVTRAFVLKRQHISAPSRPVIERAVTALMDLRKAVQERQPPDRLRQHIYRDLLTLISPASVHECAGTQAVAQR